MLKKQNALPNCDKDISEILADEELGGLRVREASTSHFIRHARYNMGKSSMV